MTEGAASAPADPLPGRLTAESDAQSRTRRLLADMQALSSRIAAVQEIVTAINKSLELDEILDIVGHQAKWLLDFDSCSICLIEQEPPEKKLITLFGPPVEWAALETEKEAPVTAAVETNQAQLVQEAGGTAVYQSIIVLPMGVETHLLGTINFASKKANIYSLDDLRIAYLLALQLAAAIHNARQFKQIRSLYGKLEEAYKNLRSLEEARDQLIHMIAHDLRNPISVMINTLDLIGLMQEPEFDEARRERLIDRAKKSGRQSLDMIDDMLMVSKMETGLLQPSLVPLSIGSLVQEREPDYRLQARREEKTFMVDFPEDLPTVLADPDLMFRVIDNLVNNAFKYTDSGGTIVISAERRDDVVEIQVQDDGEGIDPAFLDKIFNKFTQAMDEKGTPLRQGVGLGLTFCQMALEAQFGRIWVESTPQSGSTFFINLPVVS